MGNLGYLLRKELNPINDLNSVIEAESKRNLKLARWINSGKSWLRGATVGGLTGLVTGYFSDGDFKTYPLYGALIGLYIDVFQYNIRQTRYVWLNADWYQSLSEK